MVDKKFAIPFHVLPNEQVIRVFVIIGRDWLGIRIMVLLANKYMSGFTSNILLIQRQDLLMVFIAYRFNKNNERKG